MAVSSRMKQGLDWLFEISNQRRQTRHATNKKGSIELREQFSELDEQDFLDGANLVLQLTVTNRLGLPLVLFEDYATVELD